MEVEFKGNQGTKKMEMIKNEENENEIKKSQVNEIKISQGIILQSRTNKKEILIEHVEANRERIIHEFECNNEPEENKKKKNYVGHEELEISVLDLQSFRSRKFFCAPEKKKPDSEIEEEIFYQNDVSKTQNFSEPSKMNFNINIFKI